MFKSNFMITAMSGTWYSHHSAQITDQQLSDTGPGDQPRAQDLGEQHGLARHNDDQSCLGHWGLQGCEGEDIYTTGLQNRGQDWLSHRVSRVSIYVNMYKQAKATLC